MSLKEVPIKYYLENGTLSGGLISYFFSVTYLFVL